MTDHGYTSPLSASQTSELMKALKISSYLLSDQCNIMSTMGLYANPTDGWTNSMYHIMQPFYQPKWKGGLRFLWHNACKWCRQRKICHTKVLWMSNKGLKCYRKNAVTFIFLGITSKLINAKVFEYWNVLANFRKNTQESPFCFGQLM